MQRCSFYSESIVSAGYDPQRAVLEIEFSQGGQVLCYSEVPEELWYRFRKETKPESFFHSFIKGQFRECLVRIQKN